MEMVEVKIRGTAKVPAKYAPMIEAFCATNGAAFQEMADGMIDLARKAAANAGIEVDDLINAAVTEADEQLPDGSQWTPEELKA